MESRSFEDNPWGTGMAERHDNSTPGRSGSVSLSDTGVIFYYPIEDAGFLKPYMALVIQQYPTGKLVSWIDTVWTRELEEEGK